VTFTAQVASSGGTPTGNVTFMNGSIVLATKTLSGGTATFTTSSLTAGNYSITAVYAGGGSFTGSTSAPVAQVVNKAATTNTLTAAPSPATAGQTVTLTAVLAAVAPGGGIPGGTVTFRDGSVTLGTARLSGGVATFQTSTLTAGTHNLTAIWYGDSNYIGSTSPVVVLTVNAAGGAKTAVLASAGVSGSTDTGMVSASNAFSGSVGTKSSQPATASAGTSALPAIVGNEQVLPSASSMQGSGESSSNSMAATVVADKQDPDDFLIETEAQRDQLVARLLGRV
jgi:hypothetical protein